MSVALGDIDRDLDITAGNGILDGEQNAVYLNALRQTSSLANGFPYPKVTRPTPTENAGFFSTAVVLDSPTIPITVTLSLNRDGVPRRSAHRTRCSGSWSALQRHTVDPVP